MNSEEVPPLELVFSVNVIEDSQGDGNMLCAISTVLSDLLLQIHTGYEPGPISGSQLVKSVFWTTVSQKVGKKVVIDP